MKLTPLAALLTTLTLTVSAQEPAKPPQSLAPGQASSSAEVQTLPDVVVSAQAPSYAPQSASTATKLDVPLKDIPASVQVVPKELLQDRGVTRVNQMLENVSGVFAESSYGGNGATFFNIRGFTNSNGLRDGFRNYGYIAFRDVQAIERVEVLKGPAGALYGGVGSLGGYVNTISKRPLDSSFGNLSLTTGSFGLIRPTLDWNTTLGEDVSFRLNGAYEHTDGYRNQSGHESYSIAPAIRWQIDEDTSLTLLTEYGRLEREGFDFGVPNLPGYTRFGRKSYFGLPDDYGDNDTYSATLLFEHKLNQDWTLRLGGHYTYASQFSNQTFPDNYLYEGGDLLPFTNYVYSDNDSDDGSVQAELVGEFNTGSIRHNVLFGAEYGYLSQGSGPTNQYTFNMSLRNPGRISDYVFSSRSEGGRAQAQTAGVYLSDLVELSPQWKVLLSGREDWFFNETQTVNGDTLEKSEENRFSPRAGIVWQPLPTTSVYASYSKTYLPVIGHSTSNAVYAAEKGEQFELGVKQDLIADKLSATFSIYDLTRQGILTSDPTDPDKLIQTGEQRSRGFEFDLAGQISPAWKVIASYAFIDAEIRSDTFFPVGDALSNVPEHSASLWTTYQFQEGALKGLGFGAGVYFVGEREANIPNTYKLPGYWRTDATLFYEKSDWRVQVNFLNVFDKHYYTGGDAGVFNYTLDPSEPFSVQASVTYKF